MLRIFDPFDPADAHRAVSGAVTVLLFGETGSGLSTVGAASPDVLVLDADRTLHRAARTAKSAQIEQWDPSPSPPLRWDELLDGKRILTIDRLNGLIGSILQAVMLEPGPHADAFGAPTPRAWAAVRAQVVEFLAEPRRVRPDLHLLLLANAIDGRIDLPTSLLGELSMQADAIGHLRRTGDLRTIDWDKRPGDTDAHVEVDGPGDEHWADQVINGVAHGLRLRRQENHRISQQWAATKLRLSTCKTPEELTAIHAETVDQPRMIEELCWEHGVNCGWMRVDDAWMAASL